MTDSIENRPIAVKVSGVRKMYKLGQIGGGTLMADLQSWWARKRGKEDPNSKIGEGERSHGDTFMALNGIDLTIYQGEAVGIIGSNGAGKSTLLKLLSRVTAPSDGEIDIYGRIASMLEVGTGFNGELTGRENVYMNGAILGMTKAEIDAKMEEIIEFSEVREFIDTPVKRYSSGMFVKLAFSVAAHLDSEIMIMDEVLAVGDMAFQEKCLGKMREAAQKDGRTVLYVSHNMNTIRTLCERCIVLDKGKMVFEGDVEDAISLYLGNTNNTEFPSKYDFTNKNRDYHFGKQVFIKSFEFANKEKAFFNIGELMHIKVNFSSSIEIKDAQFVLNVMDASRKKGFYTLLSDCFDIGIKNNQVISFDFDNQYLTEGDYSFNFEIIKKDRAGNHYSYDNPMATVAFKLINTDAKDIIWISRYWGNIRLPGIKIQVE